MQRGKGETPFVCLWIQEQRKLHPLHGLFGLRRMHQYQLQHLSLIGPGNNVFRIGFGYDVHRLKQGRPLILGGVDIPHAEGLDGHSDADVLTHAVMDAVLGALAEGDIGRHFPDTDPAYKGASSLTLLKSVVTLLHHRHYELNNLDVTIVAQAPRLAPHIPTMQNHLAACFQTSVDRINIKATTSEGLGFCGKREGMEAFAVVSLLRRAEGALDQGTEDLEPEPKHG